jgi:hypothetical protein
MENDFITFNTETWGYDFTCKTCGRVGSVDGEAPLNARVTMIQRGWRFIETDEDFTPVCGHCAT